MKKRGKISTMALLLIAAVAFNCAQPLLARDEIKIPFGQALYEAFKKPTPKTLLDIQLFNAVKELSKNNTKENEKKVSDLNAAGASIHQVLIYAIIDGSIPINDAATVAPKSPSYADFQKALGQTGIVDSLKNFLSHDYSEKLVLTAFEQDAHIQTPDKFSNQTALEIATQIYMPLYVLGNTVKSQESQTTTTLSFSGDIKRTTPITSKGFFWISSMNTGNFAPLILGADLIYGATLLDSQSLQKSFNETKIKEALKEIVEKPLKTVSRGSSAPFIVLTPDQFKQRAEIYERVMEKLVYERGDLQEIDTLFKNYSNAAIYGLKVNNAIAMDIITEEFGSFKQEDTELCKQSEEALKATAKQGIESTIELMDTLDDLNDKLNLDIKIKDIKMKKQ